MVAAQQQAQDQVGRGDDPMRLMDFQRDVERDMFTLAQSYGATNPMTAPAQRMEDFCLGKISKAMPPTSSM